jgi:hypothetical protein
MSRLRTVASAVVVSVVVTGASAPAGAESYPFAGAWIDVDAWVGSGDNETVLVVDWNKLDNGPATVTEAHAFGYRWDGTKYVADMLQEFHDAGVFTVTTAYGGSFLDNIVYEDPAEPAGLHTNLGNGWWSMASTTDPDADWGSFGDSEWDYNLVGINEELLVDGQIEGASAMVPFGMTLPAYANDQLDVPTVPEPTFLGAVGLLGVAGYLRRRLRNA